MNKDRNLTRWTLSRRTLFRRNAAASVRGTIAGAAVVVLVGLTVACGGGAEASGGESSAPAEKAAPVENLPVEEIAATVQWSGAKLTPENATQARDAVSKGMGIRAALEAVGAVAGAPKQAGSGVANWLTRTDDGGCMNLMLTTGDGVVSRVNLDTYPKGSMGEAKCQNYGL